MIEVVEETQTRVTIEPYGRGKDFGISEFITALKKDGFTVKDYYDLKTRRLDIYIKPAINHHIDVVKTKEGIKWIGNPMPESKKMK